jgi:hypothetical protein
LARVPVPEVTTVRIIWFMYCRAGEPITAERACFSTPWSYSTLPLAVRMRSMP